MDKCARGTELAREYSNARDLIDNEVRRALHKEFDMLLSRDFLSLDSERVEYLEKLQLTIASSRTWGLTFMSVSCRPRSQ